MKFNIIIFILLISSICLSFARRYHGNEYYRHHKIMSTSESAKSRIRETMKTMSRNMKIRADMKSLGLLGMTLPDEPVDKMDPIYSAGFN